MSHDPVEVAYARLVESRGRDADAMRVLQAYVERQARQVLRTKRHELGEGRVTEHELGIRALIFLMEKAKLGDSVGHPKAYLCTAVANDMCSFFRKKSLQQEWSLLMSTQGAEGLDLLDLVDSETVEGRLSGRMGGPDSGGVDAEQRAERMRGVFEEVMGRVVSAAIAARVPGSRVRKRVDYQRVADRAWGTRSIEQFLKEDGDSLELPKEDRKRVRAAFDQRQSRARAELLEILEAMIIADSANADVLCAVRSLVVRDQPGPASSDEEPSP